MMNIVPNKNNTKDFEFETLIKEDYEKIKSITIETTYEDRDTKTHIILRVPNLVYPYTSITSTMPIFPLSYTDFIEEEPEVIFYRSLEDMIQETSTYIREEFHKDKVTTFGVKIEYDTVSYGYFPVYVHKDGKILLRKVGIVVQSA